jgi:hypothetical protein
MFYQIFRKVVISRYAVKLIILGRILKCKTVGIDLPFGRMKFAQAKAIDLAWNTLVGRGLQVLIALFAYQAFTSTLMRFSEENQVTYELYNAMSFSTLRINAITPLFKATTSLHGAWAKVSIVWLIITTVYLALFPTFIDAVSGYQSAQSTMVGFSLYISGR